MWSSSSLSLNTSSISSSTVIIVVANLVVFKEKDTFANQIGHLHEEYYKKVLKLANEQDLF